MVSTDLHLQAPTSVRGFDPRPGSEPRACPARPLGRASLLLSLLTQPLGPQQRGNVVAPTVSIAEGNWRSPRFPPPLRATKRRTEWCQREGTCRRRGRGPRARRLGPRSRIPTRPTIALLTRGPATTMPMPRPGLATPARSRPTRQHRIEPVATSAPYDHESPCSARHNPKRCPGTCRGYNPERSTRRTRSHPSADPEGLH